jgi:hypothetical protein
VNSKAEYEVKFAKQARNLLYEDSQGVLYFPFDVDSSQKPALVILETMPLSEDFRLLPENLSQTEQSRIGLALERVVEYLLSIGYQVEYLKD